MNDPIQPAKQGSDGIVEILQEELNAVISVVNSFEPQLNPITTQKLLDIVRKLGSTKLCRLESSERSETLGPDDASYELPTEQPILADHFGQDLSVARAWKGYSYTLTPGQRDWLREHYGLTPARTITLVEVACWLGTRHPKRLTIRSDEHVNPANRRHVLVEASITEPGKFFRESAARDVERNEAKSAQLAEGKEVGLPNKLKIPSIVAKRVKAKEALDDLFASLDEAGV